MLKKGECGMEISLKMRTSRKRVGGRIVRGGGTQPIRVTIGDLEWTTLVLEDDWNTKRQIG